jgi:hypothetical protein
MNGMIKLGGLWPGGGVTALREIAGLKSVSTAVPVTLQLVFVPAD